MRPDPPVVFVWHPTAQDQYRGAMALRDLTPARLVSFGLGLVVSLAGLGLAYVGRNGDGASILAGSFVVFCGDFLSTGAATKALQRGLLRWNPVIGQLTRAAVSRDGVSFAVPQAATQLAWDAFAFWFPTPDGIGLCLKEDRPFARLRAARFLVLPALATESDRWPVAQASIAGHLVRHPRSGESSTAYEPYHAGPSRT